MTLADQRRAATAAFSERTGHRPQGTWMAPGRVNLIGDHTDYNDGFALPIAIDRQVVVAARRRDDGVLRAWSLQQDGAVRAEVAELAPGKVRGWGGYVAGVAWALGTAGTPVAGADLVLTGDLPLGAGLASSAAVACATALALDDLYGVRMAPEDRAVLSQRAENDFVGVPCGVMDQLVANLGRAGAALFLDARSLACIQVPLDLAAAGLSLLVIHTGECHALTDGRYAERRCSCERAADQLGLAALRDLPVDELDAALAGLEPADAARVRHVVTENARVLAAVDCLRRGRVEDLGPLLTASHSSLRSDYQVSSPRLDLAVDAALAAGALGARMTGAGFGGCAIALVPAAAAPHVTTAVTDAFARSGLRGGSVFPVATADGGRRLA